MDIDSYKGDAHVCIMIFAHLNNVWSENRPEASGYEIVRRSKVLNFVEKREHILSYITLKIHGKTLEASMICRNMVIIA